MKNDRFHNSLMTVLLTLAVGGCTHETVTAEDNLRQEGLNLSVVAAQTSDVAGIHFVVRPCDDETVAGDAVKPLEDLLLPGGIAAFENLPLDAASQHLFADHYFLLPAGCYDVWASAVDEAGQPVEACTVAHQPSVLVEDGLTKEIVLVLQCEGPAVGGLDVVAALNFPPVIVALTYDRSKFVYRCEDLEICVTVRDPDNDPVEILWAAINPESVDLPSATQETANDDRSVTSCASFQFQQGGSYSFGVLAFDLVHPEGMTMEAWINSQGGDVVQSRASLIFPVHVSDTLLPGAAEDCTGDDPNDPQDPEDPEEPTTGVICHWNEGASRYVELAVSPSARVNHLLQHACDIDGPCPDPLPTACVLQQ